MKLPDIVQQPVGEFALGNVAVPRYDELGKAVGGLAKATAGLYASVVNEKKVAEVDEATGEAAKELSELRATLVNQNTVDADWVGDDAVGEIQVSTVRNGERESETAVMMFTHQIAEELWGKRSQEIIAHYASTITSPKVREKFVGEMNERYAAPGTQAVMAANIIRSRSYGQAQAERAVELVLASDAPTEVRESNAKEILARQILLGADPVWAEKQVAALGPAIDQMDIQNNILAASSVDSLDQIEDGMWSGGTRLTPAQMRTQSEQINKKRNVFKGEVRDAQNNFAGQMLGALGDPNAPFGMEDVVSAVRSEQIRPEQAWTFYNALQSGSTTKASDPFILSRYRGAINTMQYTGNNARVADRAKLLRMSIVKAQYGLNPDDSINPLGASISGEDAFKLMKDIDAAERAALENDAYDNALKDVLAWTRVKVNLEGQIEQGLGGSQHTVDAAIAMKTALDTYMDQFGADADPVSWVQSNKDAYNPNNFAVGINARFIGQVPQAASYMTINPDTDEATFTQGQQTQFVDWFNETVPTMDDEEVTRIWTLFKQYYRGEGIAPDGGALMLESDDPIYRQFEAMMMPDVDQ